MFRIRWVCKDQSKRLIDPLEVFENVLSDHCSGEARLFEIEPDRFDRLRMVVDKHGLSGASAESFYAKCTAASKKVEHTGAGDQITQRGKNRFPNHVHRWADIMAWRLQGYTPGGSGNDSHIFGPREINRPKAS